MTACSQIFQEFLYRNQLVLAVIVVVLAVRLLIGKLPKRYAYLLWAVVGIRMIVGIYYPSVFSLFNLVKVPEQAWSGQESSLLVERLSPNGGVAAGGLSAVGVEDGVSETVEGIETLLAEPGLLVHGEAFPFWQTISFLLSLIWIIGTGMILCYGIVSYIRCRRMVREAVRQEGNVWECQNLPSPFVLGLFRPRIYLPFHLPEEERRYILEHERCHIRRRDPFVKLVAFVLLSVYWINPLAWLSYVLMTQDMEMSCDEAVLRKLGAGIKKGYSASLLSFAVGKRKVTALSLAFGESPSFKRIRHVLQYRQPKRGKGFIGIAVAVLLAALCLTDQPEAKATGEKEQAAGKSAEPSGEFYRLYPHIIDYMGMTYSEYQELTGQDLQLVEKDFFSGGLCTGALPGTGAEVVLKGSYDVEKGEYEINEEAKFVRLQGKLSDFVSLPEGESLQMSLAELFIRLSSSGEREIRNLLGRENEYDIEATCFSMNLEVDWRGEEKREAILTFVPEGGVLLNQVDPEMRVWLSWTWETVR